jgi:hypothetical protein
MIKSGKTVAFEEGEAFYENKNSRPFPIGWQ